MKSGPIKTLIIVGLNLVLGISAIPVTVAAKKNESKDLAQLGRIPRDAARNSAAIPTKRARIYAKNLYLANDPESRDPYRSKGPSRKSTWILKEDVTGKKEYVEVEVEVPPSSRDELFKAAPRALWDSFKKTTLGQTTLQFPPEAFAFYLATGFTVVMQLAVASEKDPLAFENYLNSLSDPVGYASFYAFMYTNRKVSSKIFGLKGMAEHAHILQTLAKTGGRFPLRLDGTIASKGRVALARAITAPVNYLGMAAGSFVSEVFAEVILDPNIQQCATGLIALAQRSTTAEQREMWKEVCNSGFGHFVTSESGVRHLGSITSLLAGTAALSVADAVVTATTKRRMATHIVRLLGFMIPFRAGAAISMKIANMSEKVTHFVLFFGAIDFVGVEVGNFLTKSIYQNSIKGDFTALKRLRDKGIQEGWKTDPVLRGWELYKSSDEVAAIDARCRGLADQVLAEFSNWDLGPNSWRHDVKCNVRGRSRSFFDVLKDYSKTNGEWRRALLDPAQTAYGSWERQITTLATDFNSARYVYQDFFKRVQRRKWLEANPDSDPRGEAPREESLYGPDYDTHRSTYENSMVIFNLNELAYERAVLEAKEEAPYKDPTQIERWPIYNDIFASYKQLADGIMQVVEENAKLPTKEKMDKSVVENLRILHLHFKFGDSAQPVPREDVQVVLEEWERDREEGFDLAKEYKLSREQIQELAEHYVRLNFLIGGSTRAKVLSRGMRVHEFPELKRVSKPLQWKSPFGPVTMPFFGSRGFEVFEKIMADIPGHLVNDLRGHSAYADFLDQQLSGEKNLGMAASAPNSGGAEDLVQEEEDIYPSHIGYAKVRSTAEFMIASMACGPRPVDTADASYLESTPVIHRSYGSSTRLRPPRIITDVGFEVCTSRPLNTPGPALLGLYDFNPFVQTWQAKDRSGVTYRGIIDLIVNNLDPNLVTEGASDYMNIDNFDAWWVKQVMAPMDQEYERQASEYQEYLLKYVYPVVAGHDSTHSHYRPISGFWDLIANINNFLMGRDNNLVYFYNHVFHPNTLHKVPAESHIYDPLQAPEDGGFGETAMGSINNEAVVLMKAVGYVGGSLLKEERRVGAARKLDELTRQFSATVAEIQQMYSAAYKKDDVKAKTGELIEVIGELLQTYQFPHVSLDLIEERKNVNDAADSLYRNFSYRQRDKKKADLWAYYLRFFPRWAFATDATEVPIESILQELIYQQPQASETLKTLYRERMSRVEYKLRTEFDTLEASERARYQRHRPLLVFATTQLIQVVNELSKLIEIGRDLNDVKNQLTED